MMTPQFGAWLTRYFGMVEFASWRICNTIYMGMSFYVAENFQQHNFIHDIKNEIDAVILFLRQMVDYYAGMIKNIQGQ